MEQEYRQGALDSQALRPQGVVVAAAPVPTQPAPGMLDPVFRNGSITVVGVIAGFSLGFLTAWGANPLPWGLKDLIALIPIVLGVVFQLVALSLLLDPRSLELRRYTRARYSFMIGLILVAVGVAAALGVDVWAISYGHHVVETPD